MTVRKGFFASMALAVTLITAGPASAQGLDPASQEALADALSAQIFDELTRNSGGDARKMTEALERAKSDPAGFAAMLSASGNCRSRSQTSAADLTRPAP